MKMKRMKKFEWFNLRECIAMWSNLSKDSFDGVSALALLEGSRYKTQLQIIFPNEEFDDVAATLPFMIYDSENLSWSVDEDAVAVLNAVSRRFADNYLVKVEEEETEDAAFLGGFDRLTSMLANTFTRYKAMLNAYRAKEGKLLDPVKSETTGTVESTGKFKDTAQTDIEPESDSYNTNVTNTSTESGMTVNDDRQTVAERLDEIRRKIRDVLTDWTDEFGALFLDEANVY